MNEKVLKYLYDNKLDIDEIGSYFVGKRNILLTMQSNTFKVDLQEFFVSCQEDARIWE